MNYQFKILEKDFACLKEHLYPGDHKEAISLAICGRTNDGSTFLVHKIINIPHEECERKPDFIRWPTSLVFDELPVLVRKNLAIFKIHSHPGGYGQFSELDDESDLEFFESIYGWFDSNDLHGSLVLLPDDNFFGRVVNENLNFEKINRFSVVGKMLQITDAKENSEVSKLEANLRNIQTLGMGTQKLLGLMTIGVVGCSGTGSPVIEQLARLGVGKLVLVDPDKVEQKNLNRIINSKKVDAENHAYKVDVIKEAIDLMGFDTKVTTFKSNLYEDLSAIETLSNCDFLFGCMDSIDGRYLLNCISSFYLIPYLDIGVKIMSDKKGGLDQICGTIHFLLPGESSLQTRGVYTHEELRAANLLRVDKEEFEEQKKSGYIVDVDVDAPAVISINMQAASLAVNEFLSRVHPIKVDEIEEFDIIRFSLTDFYFLNQKSDNPIDSYLLKYTGRGCMSPLLNMPNFSHEAII